MAGLLVETPSIDPSAFWEAITKSDATTYTGIRSIYVGGAGDVTAVDASGNAVLFAAVPAGTTLPIQPTMIKSTGTSATGIVAFR